MDEFEKFLRHQPLRPPPENWRAEILAAAAQAPVKRVSKWTAWLWPSPYAWGALAAVWVVIFSLNAASMPRRNENLARDPSPTPQEMMAFVSGWRQWERELFPQPATATAAPALPRPQAGSPGAFLYDRKRRPVLVS